MLYTHTGMHCIVTCVWSAEIPHTVLLLLKDGRQFVIGVYICSKQSSILDPAHPMAALGGRVQLTRPCPPNGCQGEGPTH